MRFFEISSGIRLPVSGEEQEIIDMVASKKQIAKSDLDERQQEVARKMVSRGILNRGRDNDSICMTLNSSADLWRF